MCLATISLDESQGIILFIFFILQLSSWGGKTTTPQNLCQINYFSCKGWIIWYTIFKEGNQMPGGIQVGSHGTESNFAILDKENLRDAVMSCFELASSIYPDLGIEYTLEHSRLPSRQGLDINFYPPFLYNGKDCQKCTGEALFTYNGKPILLVTRTYAENGADATTAKLYRKQYWYEKVKSYNSHFSHVTFVTALKDNDYDNFKALGSDLVYPYDINEFNFGQNSVYISDDVHGERFYRDVIIKALNKAINVYEKTY
jgi:hypothetical protein